MTRDEVREVVAEVLSRDGTRGIFIPPSNGARVKFYSAVLALFLGCSTIGGFVATLWVDSKVRAQVEAREEAVTRRMEVAAGEYVKREELTSRLAPMLADDRVIESRYSEILRRLDGVEVELRRLGQGR